MPRWRYYSLEVLGAGGYNGGWDYVKREPDGRSYLEIDQDTSRYYRLLDKLYGGKIPNRLPLNPQQDWVTILRVDRMAHRREVLAWDEDAGYADVATEVINKLGLDGWELAGIDEHRYIFKKSIGSAI